MLWPALEDPDPVLIFEHAMLYATEGDVPEPAPQVDINRAKIRRPGAAVSLFSFGGTLHKTMQAAETLAADGVDCEVIDLRVLRPLDTETIIASVRRNHRAVIVDEGWQSGSISAEITTRIMEQAFYDLDAPVARVCSVEVPMPYAQHLEEAALPQATRIVETVRRLVSESG